MPRGAGFTIMRVSLGSSRGVVINHLGRRRRSPSDAGEGRQYHPVGIQYIPNAQLPLQRRLDDELRRAELRRREFCIIY